MSCITNYLNCLFMPLSLVESHLLCVQYTDYLFPDKIFGSVHPYCISK